MRHAVALALVALIGCSPAASNSDGSCSTDADCTGGQFCQRGMCTAPACSVDADCKTSYLCNHHACFKASGGAAAGGVDGGTTVGGDPGTGDGTGGTGSTGSTGGTDAGFPPSSDPTFGKACLDGAGQPQDSSCNPPHTYCSYTQMKCVTGCADASAGYCTADTACDTSHTAGKGGRCQVIVPSTPVAGGVYFAVLGDTRPASKGDSYPSDSGTIFGLISPRKPSHVFVTGDLTEARGDASQAQTDLTEFLRGQGNYTWSGPVHYVPGNHEAGVESVFSSMLNTNTYWAFTDGQAKYVGISDNQWDSTQSAWLTQQLSVPTKYTFIFRHHPYSAYGLDAGVNSAIVGIIDAHPFTLVIAGHDHSFYVSRRHWLDQVSPTYSRGREVVCGNGGAPLATSSGGGSNAYFGYAMIQQLPDGAIAITSYREDTDMPADTRMVNP